MVVNNSEKIIDNETRKIYIEKGIAMYSDKSTHFFGKLYLQTHLITKAHIILLNNF
jgi:hypothetical protein